MNKFDYEYIEKMEEVREQIRNCEGKVFMTYRRNPALGCQKNIMTDLQKVEKFISQLECEADACDEIGSSFSAASMREEADRLKDLLKKGIIPKDIND